MGRRHDSNYNQTSRGCWVTCGACNPEAFNAPLGLSEGARAVGYTCASNPESHIKNLYFHGASFVFFDTPSRARIALRPGMRRLSKVCRKGDMVIVARASDLGSKPATQDATTARLEGLGIQVRILTQEGIETCDPLPVFRDGLPLGIKQHRAAPPH